MKNSRLFVLCSLTLALVLSLSLSASGNFWCNEGYAGAATNFSEGTCYWQCCSGSVGSAPAGSGKQCRQLCAAACGGSCIPLY